MGIDIDNKLECLGQNFKKAHTKAQNIISNWKARKLPINGRITISKFLIISQFNYMASIISSTPSQIKTRPEVYSSTLSQSVLFNKYQAVILSQSVSVSQFYSNIFSQSALVSQFQ